MSRKKKKEETITPMQKIMGVAAQAQMYKDDVFFPDKQEFVEAKDLRPEMISWFLGFALMPASWLFFGWEVGVTSCVLFFMINYSFFHGRYKV